MNKSFYNQESIDAYLTNKMSGEDKNLFENGLAKDPLIQNEINLQKDIIESLKQVRKAELKNRLNNIEIGRGLNTAFNLKIAASIIILIGLLSGVYFLFNKKSDTIAIQKPLSNTKIIEVKNNDNNTPQKLSSGNEIRLGNKLKKQIYLPSPIINNSTNSIQNNTETTDIVTLDIVSPQIKENFEEDFKVESNFVVPEGNVIKENENYKSDVELSIQPNGENNFHYQYYSNKLYLYCDFHSKPYELLEWNKRKTKQLYLYFNNSYYELKHNQTDIVPLTPINDKSLIKQLDSIKDK